ncbi:hypothetical protein GIB67_002135, partial [Kingdonia uniflora]
PNPKAIADASSLSDVVSREGTELNKVLGALGIRKEKRLNSIVDKLSVAWKSVAEVLKLQKEKALWSEQLKREKAEQKEQFKAEATNMKKEVEADAKKTFDKKYSEIIFPDEDASPVADHPSEQTLAPEPDNTPKEEVVRLRGKVIEMEKALSRARDSITRTKQVHNNLKYERRLHKSNFDNTFKELFELQCRYGKIKIKRDEVL